MTCKSPGGTTGDPGADVRATPEYSAAWDLELWKEGERQRFTRALEEERSAQRRKFEQDSAADQRRREQEWEQRRSQVERLAQRVARSLDVLRKRQERVERKEEELGRHRAGLAREWEQKARDADERIRRATENGYFATQTAQTHAQEMKELAASEQRKVKRIQEEYDKLCTEFATWRREHLTQGTRPAADAEKAELERELKGEREQRRKAEEERDTATAKLRKARTQTRRLRQQLSQLAEEHNRVLREAHRQQAAALDKERDSLERAAALQHARDLRDERERERARHQFAATYPSANGTPGGIPPMPGSTGSPTIPAMPAAPPPAATGGDELRALIDDLLGQLSQQDADPTPGKGSRPCARSPRQHHNDGDRDDVRQSSTQRYAVDANAAPLCDPPPIGDSRCSFFNSASSLPYTPRDRGDRWSQRPAPRPLPGAVGGHSRSRSPVRWRPSGSPYLSDFGAGRLSRHRHDDPLDDASSSSAGAEAGGSGGGGAELSSGESDGGLSPHRDPITRSGVPPLPPGKASSRDYSGVVCDR